MQIAIASGKGGAGKTSVTASLAAVWDGPLMAVDADVEAPNLHLFLRPRIEEERTAWLDVPHLSPEKCLHCEKCRDICSYKAIASFVGRISIFPDMCHGCNGCFAVCPSGALTRGRRELGRLMNGSALDGRVGFLMGRTRIGESMTPPLLRQEQARLAELLAAHAGTTKPDVLVDAPPGVSCPAVTVAREADVLLLVADPTPFGFHDFRLAHQSLVPLDKPICVVTNRAGAAGNAQGDAAVRTYCREQGLPHLGELPFDRAAAEHYARGGLVAELSPDWRGRFARLRDELRRAAVKKEDAHA